MAKAQKKLGEILVEWGFVQPKEVEKALAHAKQKHLRLGEALLDLKLCTENHVYKALAQQFGMEYIDLDKNSVTMGETQRRNREREFADVNREFQRKQREFREDLNQRRNEELAQVVEMANRVIRQIAEQEKFDIIFQDAVFASPRIDITDKVIKALDSGKPPAK